MRPWRERGLVIAAMFAGLTQSVAAPASARAQDPAEPVVEPLKVIPRAGEWIRASWFVGGDSTICGRLVALEPDTIRVRVLRLQPEADQPKRLHCPPNPGADQATRPVERRYAMARIPAVYVHRPRDARHAGWVSARRGAGEGAILGLLIGAGVGYLVSGKEAKGAMYGVVGGTAVGAAGGGAMSYQAAEDNGWVYVGGMAFDDLARLMRRRDPAVAPPN